MPLKEKEKTWMQNLVKDQKFVDEEFSLPSEEWMRPHEMVEKPELFVEGPSHMDIIQDNLGDCWFLAAATVVAQHPHLIHQVIPKDQPLYGKDYQGILMFRFWNLGKWVPVFIDDRLCVTKNKQLLYGRCTKKNEFWLPLLEKAFAKFHGAYGHINGGMCDEALLVLTGYIAQFLIQPQLSELELFNLFSTEVQHNSLIAVGAPVGAKNQGIPGRHAYSVTGAYCVRVGDNIVRLVRVRNPWGSRPSTVEWKGAFNDNDPRWTGVDAETRKKLEYIKEEDGQFFMRVSHFMKHYPLIWIASPFPDFGDNYERTPLQTFVISNIWEEGIAVVGDPKSENCQGNFLKLPQYILTVEEGGDQQLPGSEKESDTPPIYNVVIQVIQEQNRGKFRGDIYMTGILVYQIGGKFPRKLTAETIEDFEALKGSAEPNIYPSALAKLQLDPGKYLVVPFVSETRVSRKFLMRVYSRKPIKIAELKRE